MTETAAAPGSAARAVDGPGPLAGVRVVELGMLLAGPFTGRLLGDMGGEVIKSETPGEGDPVRRQGAIRDGLSWYFAAFNRNKPFDQFTIEQCKPAAAEVPGIHHSRHGGIRTPPRHGRPAPVAFARRYGHLHGRHADL